MLTLPLPLVAALAAPASKTVAIAATFVDRAIGASHYRPLAFVRARLRPAGCRLVEAFGYRLARHDCCSAANPQDFLLIVHLPACVSFQLRHNR
jgi:hypothetical protein